jgi:small-conductance mechanosensitive channel
MAVQAGNMRLSLLGLIKVVIALCVFLWAAGFASTLVEKRVSALPGVTPAAGVLLGKLFRIAAYAIAVIVGLETVGIDLTTFAVFSGAIGLGIGFGLQKVFSNLISGLILLMDRSVKPGDVIGIGDTFGWINSLGARYVSVITRDGTEHLIPNEELISQRVENWSHSNELVRLRLDIGVTYEADVRKAMDLAVEAAIGVERVLEDPAPVCRLMEFGGDSVNLQLRVWIKDPKRGVVNVTSDVLLGVWDLYKENDIDFPFAQRDLHIKSAVPLPVQIASSDSLAEPDAKG